MTSPARTHPCLRRARNESGSVAVEFALVVPILVLVISAIVAFGAAYSKLQVLNGAAREGARVAAVRGTIGDAQSRTEDAAAPYTLSETPTVSRQCDDTTVGEPVTVSWQQTFTIEILGLPVFHPTKMISGTFRCE